MVLVRTLLISSSVAVLALLVVWLAEGPDISALFDIIYTVPEASLPVGHYGIDVETFSFGTRRWFLAKQFSVAPDSRNRLTFSRSGRSFTFGPITKCYGGPNPYYEFTPDPDDQIAAALPWGFNAQGHWVLCTPVGDADADAQGSKLLRSIRRYVDDDEKRSNFLVMLTAIWRAATQQDYGAVLANSTVTPKPAHSFSYQNKKHSVLELKQGKKDRIYFFAERLGSRACIVLLLAHHKKDQTTPKEVCNHCEQAMKNCLAHTTDVEIK